MAEILSKEAQAASPRDEDLVSACTILDSSSVLSKGVCRLRATSSANTTKFLRILLIPRISWGTFDTMARIAQAHRGYEEEIVIKDLLPICLSTHGILGAHQLVHLYNALMLRSQIFELAQVVTFWTMAADCSSSSESKLKDNGLAYFRQAEFQFQFQLPLFPLIKAVTQVVLPAGGAHSY
ncbi:hypothetical protein Tco_0316877 [Tanacetum coccineum]